MRIKRDLLKGSGGFAVDAYYPETEFGREDGTCMRNSSEQLKYLIDHCEAGAVLRELTVEERELIAEYQKEQKGT